MLGTFSASWSMCGPKSAVGKNIDINIADILDPEISANIDIGKGDIDPALLRKVSVLVGSGSVEPLVSIHPLHTLHSPCLKPVSLQASQ